MRQIWPEIRPWITAGKRFALATLVEAEGSSPREVGAVMAIRPEGRDLVFCGGVSSGCVENDLLARARPVLEGALVEEHRFASEAVMPWATGLTCGGSIRVRLEPYFLFSRNPVMQEIARVWHEFIEADEPGALLSRGHRHLLLMADGSVLGERREWPDDLLGRALSGIREGSNGGFLAGAGEAGVFVRFQQPRPQLVVIGAVEIAVALAKLVQALPVRMRVIDPREVYARPARFGEAELEVVRGWPEAVLSGWELGRHDALVVLSHDEKIDDPALVAALRGPCGFVGALGSRTSQERRLERLRGRGLHEDQLARLRGPVGLWHGGRDARSIALSILSEWVSRGGGGT